MIYAGNTDASSIMSSDFFTFIVGPEKQLFYMHSALVASLSKQLDRVVNIGREETKNRRVL